jgi:hypothetical protein
VTTTQNMSNQSLYSPGNHSRTTSGTEHRKLGSSLEPPPLPALTSSAAARINKSCARWVPATIMSDDCTGERERESRVRDAGYIPGRPENERIPSRATKPRRRSKHASYGWFQSGRAVQLSCVAAPPPAGPSRQRTTLQFTAVTRSRPRPLARRVSLPAAPQWRPWQHRLASAPAAAKETNL